MVEVHTNLNGMPGQNDLTHTLIILTCLKMSVSNYNTSVRIESRLFTTFPDVSHFSFFPVYTSAQEEDILCNFSHKVSFWTGRRT